MGISRAAIVVLGGKVRRASDGTLSGALVRRARAGAAAYLSMERPLVVASGGCVWSGLVEADAIADVLRSEGVRAEDIVRERCSFSTRDNARYSARVLARRGIEEAFVVTDGWHMPRAQRLFEREGVRVQTCAIEDGPAVSLARRVWRWGKERVAMQLDGVG